MLVFVAFVSHTFPETDRQTDIQTDRHSQSVMHHMLIKKQNNIMTCFRHEVSVSVFVVHMYDLMRCGHL